MNAKQKEGLIKKIQHYESVLEGLGLKGKERYYYIKESFAGSVVWGIATVCIIPTGRPGEYVRGISFCVPTDEFVKLVGRANALARAMKAMKKGHNTELISMSTPAKVLSPQMKWLSEYNPSLTAREIKLFEERTK